MVGTAAWPVAARGQQAEMPGWDFSAAHQPSRSRTWNVHTAVRWPGQSRSTCGPVTRAPERTTSRCCGCSRRARGLHPAICCACGWAWKGEGYRRPRQSVPWPHRLEPPIWRGGFEAHRTDQQTTVEYTTEAAGERCGRVHVLLSAARETTDKGPGLCHDPGTEDHSNRGQRHARRARRPSCTHALEQAQASAATVSVPALLQTVDAGQIL